MFTPFHISMSLSSVILFNVILKRDPFVMIVLDWDDLNAGQLLQDVALPLRTCPGNRRKMFRWMNFFADHPLLCPMSARAATSAGSSLVTNSYCQHFTKTLKHMCCGKLARFTIQNKQVFQNKSV